MAAECWLEKLMPNSSKIFQVVSNGKQEHQKLNIKFAQKKAAKSSRVCPESGTSPKEVKFKETPK